MTRAKTAAVTTTHSREPRRVHPSRITPYRGAILLLLSLGQIAIGHHQGMEFSSIIARHSIPPTVLCALRHPALMLGLGEELDMSLDTAGYLLGARLFRGSCLLLCGKPQANERQHVGNAARRGAVVFPLDRPELGVGHVEMRLLGPVPLTPFLMNPFGQLLDGFGHAITRVAIEDRVEFLRVDMHAKSRGRRQKRTTDRPANG